ncbi:MAG TPA: alpha/beta hydrolase [Clostridia bacterium]
MDKDRLAFLLERKVWKDELWFKELDGMTPTFLWEDGAPGFDPSVNQRQPALYFLPAHAGPPRGIVIVCAGGAFMYKSDDEAGHTAARFHAAGFQVAILDYRVYPYTQRDWLADGKRAIRYVRTHAAEWNVRPDKIAMLGYSAGGMLSGMCGTLFDYGDTDAEDPVERVSCRPDTAMLCYGAFCRASFPKEGTGFDRAAQQEAASFAPEKNVRNDCPPFFMFQTLEDDPRNILTMGMALADRGILMEAHLFPTGAHGQGLYDGKHPSEPLDKHTVHWSELAVEWLEMLDFKE